MKNNLEVKRLVKELDQLTNIMNTVPRDSRIFGIAQDLYTSEIFNSLAPQDFGLITKYLGRQLTNTDFAKVIVANKHNQSLADVFNLPISIIAMITLRRCQRELGLSQSQFAKKYSVPQAKMSKMESGKQKTDIDLLQRILHDTNNKLVIE